MSEDQEKQLVEIEENISEPEPTAFAVDGLLPEEVEMAKEHGLLKEVEEKSKEDLRTKDDGSEKETDEHEEQPEPEAEEDTSEEVKTDEKEEKVGEHPTFDDVEKDEGKLKKYNKNEQALYWKWKTDKKKKQAAIREKEELRAKYELDKVRGISLAQKIEKIQEALKGEVTVEQLQSIIGEKIEEPKEEKEDKSAEIERAERIELTEKIGNSRYDNFEELTQLAAEVVQTKKTYQKALEAAFTDPNLDESDLVEEVVALAKLHPNYGKKEEPKSEKKTEDTKVDRAIKNSKKKISSAAVGSGTKRNISPEDLTVDDAAKLSPEQWSKLPDRVRERLLMQ